VARLVMLKVPGFMSLTALTAGAPLR
jgi:hypothetical protein